MAAQNTDGGPGALLLDCLGTLVRLEPPGPRLAALLDVPAADAERAMREEIRFYRAHMHAARDAGSLAELRAQCASVVERELGVPVSVDALLAALRFEAFEEVPRTLAALRERGLKLAVVSNWDVSLHDVLARTGVEVDFAISSAEAGAAKPDPAPFAAALEALGVTPEQAWHVGDSAAEDVAGARALGMRGLLLAREGGGDLRTLDELLRWIQR